MILYMEDLLNLKKNQQKQQQKKTLKNFPACKEFIISSDISHNLSSRPKPPLILHFDRSPKSSLIRVSRRSAFEYGPRREKTCLWGFRQSKTQASILSYRD